MPDHPRRAATGGPAVDLPIREPNCPPDDCWLRWFGALLTSHTLEGVGYIIAGTFLAAAIDQTAPGWVGRGAWVLVGLAALPSSALWAFPQSKGSGSSRFTHLRSTE
ncbi:YbfB/YjiJ family MFS transporter [Micromonospora inositola]|uniref:Uncharacterized MFS-type transporter YbfB n=1 Tax=Micromonospora inositola TaxID=47865 RepID=A0A1C5JRD2_9ACTN|nr:YbfB/YjiJ family MFS transporter [Micromonospora inositola]SCG73067.1 Uncharacterised MFS-type transporter YbfB [Micromonospora inositola]